MRTGTTAVAPLHGPALAAWIAEELAGDLAAGAYCMLRLPPETPDARVRDALDQMVRRHPAPRTAYR